MPPTLRDPPSSRSPRRRRRLACALAAAVLAAGSAEGGAVRIRDPGQGRVDVDPGAAGAAELSGIAYAGGSRFYAVSDNGGQLFPLHIGVDAATGMITTASAAAPIALRGGVDLEGIALRGADTVVVCDEVAAVLREYRLPDGAGVRQIPLPAVFRKARRNLSVESVASDGEGLWIANEEALRGDGPAPSAERGTLVRLQHLDASGDPDGQWAYLTDPYPGSPIFGRANSGVSDLLALPGGGLLVLERSFSSQGFRARIYQADLATGTRTDAVASLAAAVVTPVAKRLLWDSGTFAANYEGLTLGPMLAAGDRSLLLVADDNGAGPPGLYPLRLELAGPASGAPGAARPQGE